MEKKYFSIDLNCSINIRVGEDNESLAVKKAKDLIKDQWTKINAWGVFKDIVVQEIPESYSEKHYDIDATQPKQDDIINSSNLLKTF